MPPLVTDEAYSGIYNRWLYQPIRGRGCWPGFQTMG